MQIQMKKKFFSLRTPDCPGERDILSIKKEPPKGDS